MFMLRNSIALLVLALAAVPGLNAQVPDRLESRLLFTLGAADAGFEVYQVTRVEDGYRLTGEVDLTAGPYHILQSLEIGTGARLELRTGRVEATVNGETTAVALWRQDDHVIQERTTGGSTASDTVETPATSVLMSNNVIHHIAQFAWLHDGAVGETQEFLAFPRVPVTVELQDAGSLTRGDESLSFRRYFMNVANMLGVYVWLADDGRPLKITVPLQSFEAVDETYKDWSEALIVSEATPDPSPGSGAAYNSEEVRFESGAITLAGTLSTPRGRGPWPAALLITGSGAQDRDENTPGPGGLKLGIFRTIADTLVRRDIAVLRCDDRGVGASGGDLNEAGLRELVSDAQAAVRFLRSRPDIDSERIALVGHSEGGIIAPIVAASDSDIAAIVLMAGTAAPLDSVIVEQTVGLTIAAGGDSADVERARTSTLDFMQAIREGREPEDVELTAGQQRWLREHIEHDPLATIREVTASVLVVNGGQDIQVVPDHARRLGDALGEAGHHEYEVKIFPELNHLFAVSRGEGLAEYVDPDAEIDPVFLSYLADWLVARLANLRS